MLILTRKEDESILLGDDIVLKIIETTKNSVKIGIEAPKNMLILREELVNEIKDNNLQANKPIDNTLLQDLHRLLKNDN